MGMKDIARVVVIILLLIPIPSMINGVYGNNNGNGSSSSRGNDDSSTVDLLDIQIVPTQVIVGDAFRIKALVVNNSSDVITYSGLCESPLSAEFDTHVSIEHVPACLGFTLHELNPGESREVTGPASGIVYRAVSAGTVRAVVTFTYFIDDRMESISKELVFKVVESTSVMTDEQFKLQIGQSVRVVHVYRDGAGRDSILIKFVDILEDSRCPINAYCIRAGSVTVMLEITSTYGSMYLDLAVGDKDYSMMRIMGYTLRLLDVHPYRLAGKEIDKADYTITLLASKNIPVEHGAVRAYSDDGRKMVIVWNEQSMRGLMISESRVAQFRVEHRECSDTSMYDLCFNAITGVGTIAIDIDYDDIMLMQVNERHFTVKRMLTLFNDVRVEHTRTLLGIGASDGPVTIMDIGEDYHVTVINYQKYPTESSRPVRLTYGDSVSDGCTTTFTLVGLKGLPMAKQVEESPEAIFTKEVVNKGRCPMYSTSTPTRQ